jgi:hypothetical protein
MHLRSSDLDTKLVDVLEHDDSGLHGDAKESQKSNPRRDSKMYTRDE